MDEKTEKKVLICEFHEETNTFNPVIMSVEGFEVVRYAEGQDAYNLCRKIPCAFHGMIDGVEQGGGMVIPTISLYGPSGGIVDDSVFELLCGRMKYYVESAGDFDAVCVSLHGATCTVEHEDACGVFLEFLRNLIGEDKQIAVSCDLHANVTEKILKSADIICGYQSYPHVDFYETGYRAAELCMNKLQGTPTIMAAVTIPMMVPPTGYTSLEGIFKDIIDEGKRLVKDGTLLDFTVLQVQPWLDVKNIGSTIIAIAEEEEKAKRCADLMAKRLYESRNDFWPELLSVDEVIDRAENNGTGKPIILVDPADSPNGGAVGDSVLPAMRLLERGSKISAGMFVKDPQAAKRAYEVGVGNSAEFSVGAKFTPGMPGPLKAVGRVRSLHDGVFIQEGPAGKGFPCNIGMSAVISFGNIDIMVCEEPAASGDPQILRHFGIEPKLYDLIVVKANASFKVPYSEFAGEFCYADTPGAGASNLKYFKWKNLPSGFYPFDLPDNYRLEASKIWR